MRVPQGRRGRRRRRRREAEFGQNRFGMDWKAVRAADVAGLNAFFIEWAGLLPGPRPDIADASTGWAQDTNRLQKRIALSRSPQR
jgi:hypothetical protein